ncbi:hypothetical protein C8Q80DRAFT_1267617 [Daedaleopsis nitida]|nr:hypothetical protein C8Q80DRAFT_1267617 [Daedaleopsis nitida]
MALVPIGAALTPRTSGDYDHAWEFMLESDDAHQFLDDIHASVDSYCKRAESTQRCCGTILHRFVCMHAFPPHLAYQGREFTEDTLLERACNFLALLLHVSVYREDKTRRMTWASFKAARFDIYGLMIRFCDSASNNALRHREWYSHLEQHSYYLAKIHDIPLGTSAKFFLGESELLLMICTQSNNEIRCMDNSLQHWFLWSMMLYCCGHPCSFIVTRNYRICATSVFLVTVWIAGYKGRHGMERLRQAARFGPVSYVSHYFIEVPLLVVSLGLRRGAFRDYSTLDALLDGTDSFITWKPEITELPFFVVSAGGGWTTDQQCPMSDYAMRFFINGAFMAAGLGSKGFKVYGFRRGGATAHLRVIGPDMSKALMNHKQSSATLYEHYLYNAAQMNLEVSRLEGKVAHHVGLSREDAAAVFCGVPRQEDLDLVAPLTPEEAMVISHSYRLLRIQCCAFHTFLHGHSDHANLALALMSAFSSMLQDEEVAFINSYRTSASHDNDITFVVSADHGHMSENVVCALYKHIQYRARRTFHNLWQRHLAQQHKEVLKRARLPTLEELESRIHNDKGFKPLCAIIRSLAANVRREEAAPDEFKLTDKYMETSTMTKVDGKVIQKRDAASATRIAAMRSLINHKAPAHGGQVCPVCAHEPGRSEAQRTKVWPCLAKVVRHIEQSHPFLTLDSHPYLTMDPNTFSGELHFQVESEMSQCWF